MSASYFKEVQGTEYQHSFPTINGLGPSLPHGPVTDMWGTLLLTIVVPFQCIKGLCSVHGGKYGPSPVSPTPIWPQSPGVPYLWALSAHLGAPTFHSNQSGLPVSSLLIHPLISLAHCPRPRSSFRSLWWLQWPSKLFCLLRFFSCLNFRIIWFGSMKNVIVILIEDNLTL